MPTKKKPTAPKKPTKKKPTAPKKPTKKKPAARKSTRHKRPSFPKLCKLIEIAMRDLADISDELFDVLPEFKRLSAEDREYIFAFMDVAIQGLYTTARKYKETLAPEQPPASVDSLPPIIGALGLTGLISGIVDRVMNAQPPQEEFPSELDAIDIEGGPAQPPRLLNPGEES